MSSHMFIDQLIFNQGFQPEKQLNFLNDSQMQILIQYFVYYEFINE